MAEEAGSVGDTCLKDKKEDLKEDDCNGELEKEEEATKSVIASKCTNINVSQSSNSFRLKSSKLDSSIGDVCSTPSKPFILNPPRLSNHSLHPEKEDGKDEPKFGESLFSTPKSNLDSKIVTPLTKTSLSFLPLGSENTTTPSQSTSFSATSSPSLGFVFGQNIHEKVEAAVPIESATPSTDKPSSSEQQITTNGTSSEMLFSARVTKENVDKAAETSKSLSEAAREYEEARAQKRRYEEVPVLTGEEEEANVLQINCKLFSWSSCSWTERGRGTLRVNDLPTSPGSHRLIVRTTGSLRVVLNTKIWAGMTVDRASVKSMRITAMDSNGVVKVFLVMASPKEMDQLQKCLEWRVSNLKKSEEGPPKKLKPDDS